MHADLIQYVRTYWARGPAPAVSQLGTPTAQQQTQLIEIVGVPSAPVALSLNAKVLDLTLPLERVAEGYRAMDERRAIKVFLRPGEA